MPGRPTTGMPPTIGPLGSGIGREAGGGGIGRGVWLDGWRRRRLRLRRPRRVITTL
jgi:hypothetical protein